MNVKDCSHCLVKKYCSQKWVTRVEKGKNQLVYKKDQYIFYEGAPVFGLYLVEQGKVKITSKGPSQKEQILRLAKDGHVIGRWGNKNDFYENNAIALAESIICFIENDLLKEVCLANPEFTFELMRYYAAELRKSEKHIKRMCQMNVKEKVAATLIHLVDVFGLENQNSISVNRKEIAEIAAISMEQVSREITNLKNQKIISTDGRKIFIENLESLKEMRTES